MRGIFAVVLLQDISPTHIATPSHFERQRLAETTEQHMSLAERLAARTLPPCDSSRVIVDTSSLSGVSCVLSSVFASTCTQAASQSFYNQKMFMEREKNL